MTTLITAAKETSVGYEQWKIANEARSAELVVTNLVSNPGEWNNYFIKFSTFGFAKFYLSLRNDRKVILC